MLGSSSLTADFLTTPMGSYHREPVEAFKRMRLMRQKITVLARAGGSRGYC
jgi:hypothetical protein